MHSVADIIDAFANDPNLQILDPGVITETKSSEKLFYRRGGGRVPHSLILMVMERHRMLTPRMFFEEIYPNINTPELEEECRSFIQHFQVLATASSVGGSESAAVAPVFPPLVECDKYISVGICEGLYKLLPEMRQGALTGQVGQRLTANVASVGSTNNTVVVADKDKCCANCGIKEIDDIKLKSCTKCDLVEYCSDECRQQHEEQHAAECRLRAAA